MDATSTRDLWSEQRAYPRASVDVPVQLQHPAGPQLARMRDLSLGGMGALVEEPPGLGSMINVALELGDLGRIDAMAVVVRVADIVGLRFAGLSAEELFALQSYLNRKPARA
jgi:hypothetical protein